MTKVISKLKHTVEIEGQQIQIRALNIDNAEIERDFIEKLSPQSKHYRFLGGITHLTNGELIDLCDTNYESKMAFVATITIADREEEIGVSRYAVNLYGDSHEFSVAVADE